MDHLAHDFDPDEYAKNETDVLDYLSWADFRIATEVLISRIREFEQEQGFTFTSVYGLPRGGLTLAVTLSYKMKIPLVLERSEITDNTLIVDDCTDTGKTLNAFMKERKNYTAVLFHKPKSAYTPHFHFKQTENRINYCWEHPDERN